MAQGEEQLYDKREVDTDHVKCAGCGANMEFDPASQKLVCRHCGRTEELEKQFGAPELDYLKGLDACEQWDGETVVFRCENCGAKVLLDRAQTAKLCPFCGTAHVVEAGEQADRAPAVCLRQGYRRAAVQSLGEKGMAGAAQIQKAHVARQRERGLHALFHL